MKYVGACSNVQNAKILFSYFIIAACARIFIILIKQIKNACLVLPIVKLALAQPPMNAPHASMNSIVCLLVKSVSVTVILIKSLNLDLIAMNAPELASKDAIEDLFISNNQIPVMNYVEME